MAGKTKTIQFSKARQQLSAIIDEVQKPASAVTIIRHGKPAAVVISHEEFALLSEREGRNKKWRVAGSLKLRPKADIDKILDAAKQARIRIAAEKAARFAKDDE